VRVGLPGEKDVVEVSVVVEFLSSFGAVVHVRVACHAAQHATPHTAHWRRVLMPSTRGLCPVLGHPLPDK
jgi:hypothetical protein